LLIRKGNPAAMLELWHDDQKRLRADLPRPGLPTPEWENASTATPGRAIGAIVASAA